MLTRVLACLALAALVPLAAADDAAIKKTAKAKAEECQTALITGDYEKYADLSHPVVVEAGGGRKKMIEGMAAEFKKMKADGTEFKAVKVGDPGDPVAGAKVLYIVVPFTFEIATKVNRVAVKSALLGISGDGGKTWTFVDALPGRDSLKKSFPDLPEKLELPKKEPPTVIKD
jgi:hypothetical protein